MFKLAPNVAFVTPAGTVYVPEWLEPYFAVHADETAALFRHMKAIDLPTTAWNEWRRDIECERVSEIRTYYHLFTIWLRVVRWQKSCRVPTEPADEWGAMVWHQVTRNVARKDLTPATIDVLFKSPQEHAAT